MTVLLMVLAFILVPFVPLLIFQIMNDELNERIEKIQERPRKPLTKQDICGRM